jgi:hypothetical protein
VRRIQNSIAWNESNAPTRASEGRGRVDVRGVAHRGERGVEHEDVRRLVLRLLNKCRVHELMEAKVPVEHIDMHE